LFVFFNFTSLLFMNWTDDATASVQFQLQSIFCVANMQV